MASEWKPVALEDLAADITVGFVGSMASEYRETGVPFLRTLNLTPLRIVKDNLKFVSQEFHARIKKSALSPGDVVIARTGKPGTCAVIPDWLTDANCSDLVIVRCGPLLNNHFLAYYVNTLAGHHIAAHTVGAVQQHFNVGSARQMEINLPSLAEQEEIVQTLGALDNKITLLRETNATLEAIAQALFKSWFVDFDPVRAKAEGRDPEGVPPEVADLFPSEFEDSELGLIPKGWAVRKIEQIAERVGMGPFGSNIKVSTYTNAGIPVINGQNLKGTLLDEGNFYFISEQHADRLAGSNVQVGDIVITHRGTIGQVSLIPRGCSFSRYVVSQSQMYLRLKEGESPPSWMIFYLRSPAGQHALLSNAAQVGVPSIARPVSHLKSMRLVIPPRGHFVAFDFIVSSLIDRIAANRSEERSIANVRNTLLPRLMSGKIRPDDIHTCNG